MKKILSCFFLVVAPAVLFAQAPKSKMDSLKHLLSIAKEDTSKIFLLDQIHYAYQYSNPDSSMHYANLGLSLAKQINNEKEIGVFLNNLGNVLFDRGNYPAALKNYLQSLKIKEKTNDLRGIAITSANIGNIYAEQGEHRKAIEYISKAMKEDVHLHDSTGILIDLLNLGDIYHKMKVTDTSLQLEQQAFNLALRIKDADYLPAVQNALGNIYSDKGEKEKAMGYFRQSISSALIVSDLQVLSANYYSISDFYKERGFIDSSIFNAKKALAIGQEAGEYKRILSATKILTDLYSGVHKTDSAFHYYKLYVQAKDTLFSEEKVKEVQKLTYEEELRQEELAELKARQEEERKTNLQLIGIAVFIITLFIVVIILSKRKIRPDIIEALGLFALLLFFEFLNILAEPYIGKYSGHIPIVKLGILVIMVSVLVPIHEFLKEIVKEKLARKSRLHYH